VRLAFTGGAFRSPLARGKVHVLSLRKGRSKRDSASGGSETDSGVPAGDHESVRGRWLFGKGSTRSEKVQGEFASSALKSRRFSGAPHAVSPKLVALTAPPIAPPS
jgi:hypothetical protein